MSPEGQQVLAEWKSNRIEIERPNWDSYFMAMAHLISKRSLDPRSQFGSVLVSMTNEVISTGYNSFIRNVNNDILPNYSPPKYDWMMHSELNAILNAARAGKSTLNSKLYVNGPCCLSCLQYCWQAGIVHIIHGSKIANMMKNDEYNVNKEIFLELTKNRLIIEEFQEDDHFFKLLDGVSLTTTGD